MSDPALRAARIKIERANKHSLELQEATTDYSETNPYELGRQLEADGSEHVYRLQSLRQPPEKLSAIIGDIVHNLRSALDCLVFGLSRPAFPQLTEWQIRKIQFPIYASATKLGNEKHAHRDIPDARAKAAIEGLQPCNRKDAIGIGLLNILTLSNIDKHRNIHLGAACFRGMGYALPPGIAAPYDRTNRRLLESGAEIVRFIFPEPHPEVDMDFRPVIGIAFRDFPQPGRFVQETMSSALLAADTTSSTLEPFFS